MIIGLDIGGSITKIVAMADQRLIDCQQVKADDPVASAYGAMGKLLNLNHRTVGDVKRLFVTGVGASFLRQRLLGIETHRVEEVASIGIGGCYVSALSRAVVVSMGTGTAVVSADMDSYQIEHLIGSGVGGGTLLGLSRCLLGTRDIAKIGDLCEQGDLNRVDLLIEDISNRRIAGLGPGVTASNLGKVVDQARDADVARGLVNLVFQTIGTLAVAVAGKVQIDDIVFTGQLLNLKCGRELLQQVADLYGYRFVMPEYSEYATAIGAALHGQAPVSAHLGDELL